MKRYFNLLMLSVIFLLLPVTAKANSISKINMDIYVDKDGTAHITETWNANLNKGTEGYKPYYNLGNAKITNFSVSEKGRTYSNINNWDTNGTLSSKAYKSGINYINDGLELCWGISSYGSHNYVLKYDIEGFVVTNDDSDMIYWTLISHNLSSKPDDVSIKIYSDEKFENTLKVWDYGNPGGIVLVNKGYIEVDSNGVLKSDEYITILVKFKKGTFSTSNIIDNNFDYYYKMAEDNTKLKKDNFFSIMKLIIKNVIDTYNKTEKNKEILIFIYIFIALIILILLFLAIYVIFEVSKMLFGIKKYVGYKEIEIKKHVRTLPEEIQKYTSIPFNNNIYKTYWIAVCYKLIDKKTDFLGAVLLKWLKDGKITITKKKIDPTYENEELLLELRENVLFENDLEKNLFEVMRKASKDDILSEKEFNEYCRENYEFILCWFNEILDYEASNLVLDGKIIEKRKPLSKEKKLVITESMRDDAIVLKGFKYFLEESWSLENKNKIDLNNLDYYIIYAQILGVSHNIADLFDNLSIYSKMFDNLKLNYSFSDMLYVSALGTSGFNAAKDYYDDIKHSSSSWDGGGSSSGGSGSFGGGSSGGGGFR